MIRYTGTVIYLDGRREEFETGMRGARAWEAYATRHELPLNPTRETVDRFPVYTWQLVIAHAALNVEAGVDTWGDDVDGVVDWTASDVPPTREGHSVEA
jgi:hypothetical protein